MKTPQRPAPERVCRARPSRRLMEAILATQGHRCLSCEARLKRVEFDHVIPLGLGGTNHPENWAALCPTCHRRKTIADLKRIAKAKRQRRYHETGRSRARSEIGPFGSQRGFDQTLKKHMNGAVSRVCNCARCSAGRPYGVSDA